MNALERIRELLGERYIEKMAAGVLVSANTVRNWYRDSGVPQTKYAVRVARFAMEQGLKADELSLVRELGGEQANGHAPRPSPKRHGGRAGRLAHNPHCWKKRGLLGPDLRLVQPIHQGRLPVRQVPGICERQLRVGMVERSGDVPERSALA